MVSLCLSIRLYVLNSYFKCFLGDRYQGNFTVIWGSFPLVRVYLIPPLNCLHWSAICSYQRVKKERKKQCIGPWVENRICLPKVQPCICGKGTMEGQVGAIHASEMVSREAHLRRTVNPHAVGKLPIQRKKRLSCEVGREEEGTRDEKKEQGILKG